MLFIIDSGKQVTQIMRKHFFCTDSGCFAYLFHLTPYITPVQWISLSGTKYSSGLYLLFLAILNQLFSQFFYQIDLPYFSFTCHFYLSLHHGFYCNIAQLTDPDSRPGNCLHYQCNLFFSFLPGRLHQFLIFFLFQFSLISSKHLLLALYSFYTAFIPAQVPEI